MGRPAVGRPGPARRRLPAGRLDRPGRASRGPDRGHLRLSLRDRPEARTRHATRGRADAGRVHGRRGGPRPPTAAVRDGPLRGHPPARHGPTSAPGPALDRPRPGRDLGEPPRQLLPGAGRARPGLARGPARSGARDSPGPAGRARECCGRVPDAVRSARLELRRRPVDQPAGDRADHRMAAHLAAQRARHPLLSRPVAAVVVLIARRRDPRSAADARGFGGLRRDRRGACRGGVSPVAAGPVPPARRHALAPSARTVASRADPPLVRTAEAPGQA